jgi:hypothetical protein
MEFLKQYSIFVIDVIKVMDLGLDFKADVQWLTLISSNGFGG